MKDSISFSIPKPCHEKWESFNPTTLGGFCSGCQKEVIDFTSWDDDQIKNYFKDHSTSTCGRFRADQLKAYHFKKIQPSFIQKFIPFSAAFSIIMLLSTKPLAAQQRTINQQEIVKPNQEDHIIGDTTQIDNRVHITGVVVDEEAKPIAGASVFLNSTAKKIFTDEVGRFDFVLENLTPNEVLVVTKAGYQSITKFTGSSGRVNIRMIKDASMDPLPVRDLSFLLQGIMGTVVVNPIIKDEKLDAWEIKQIFK
jgi:hypothetical protein